MPNPRTPAAKARVTGADAKNPQRHRDRKDPKGTPLGKPSAFLDDNGKSAWEGFKRELPWLIEVCAKVRGGLLSGEDVGVSKLNMLQTMLSKLGATPADRTRIAIADDDEEEDEFFDS